MLKPSRLAGTVGRSALVLWGFAFLCVLVPGLFFWGTWYGKRLGDAALAAFLSEEATPHETRHALEEVTLRFEEGAPGMDRWVADVVAVSERSDESLRVAAAWAMQYDAGRAEFVARLEAMLTDTAPLVRRNAATSLAAGGSGAGLPVLRAMLEPFTVTAPAAGALETAAGKREVLPAGGFVARLALDGGDLVELRAPVPGTVRDVAVAEGERVAAGAPVVVLAPGERHVMNAAKALMLVGEAEDVERMKTIAGPRGGYPKMVQDQARAALAAIRERVGE